MKQFIAFTHKNSFFPLIALCYGLFYLLYGEGYPFHNGFSTDGSVFLDLIRNFNKSHYFDTYYIHRIFPLLVTKNFVTLTGGDILDDLQIMMAFKIINIVCLVITCYLLKHIFNILKVSLKNQLFFFILFFFNFGISKFYFYFPAMTDQMAMMLSTALLFFYLRNNTIGIICCTLTLAFTWPVAYYMGLILIAFPISPIPYSPVNEKTKKIIQGSISILIFILLIYFVFILKMDTDTPFVSKIPHTPIVLFLSIVGTTALYFFFTKIFFNKTFWDVNLFMKKLNYTRILLSVGTFATVYIIIYILQPFPAYLYPAPKALALSILCTLIKPLLTIVADVSYYGIFMCMLILFWSSICKTISQMGWGIIGAIAFNLFLFGTTIETRQLINLLPWLIVFLAKAVDKYSFSKSFYVVASILTFITSKIWLKLNIYNYNEWAVPDENGNLGFPDQILWMNLGPWMNVQMYYIQGVITIILLAILFFTLYKVERNGEGKLLLIKKF